MKGSTVWLKPEGASAMMQALRIEYGGRTYYRTATPVDRHYEFGRGDRLEVGATIKAEVIVPQDVAEAIAMAVEARYRQRVVEDFLGSHPEVFEPAPNASAPPNIGDLHNWAVDEVPAAEKVGFS